MKLPDTSANRRVAAVLGYTDVGRGRGAWLVGRQGGARRAAIQVPSVISALLCAKGHGAQVTITPLDVASFHVSVASEVGRSVGLAEHACDIGLTIVRIIANIAFAQEAQHAT